MRIAHRLALGFGLLVAMMMAVIAYHRSVIADLQAIQDELTRSIMPTAIALVEMTQSIDQQIDLVQKVFVVGFDPDGLAADYAEKLDQVGRRFDDSVAELAQHLETPSERALLARIQQLWLSRSTPQATLHAARQADPPAAGVEVARLEGGGPVGATALAPTELAELGRLDRLRAAVFGLRRSLETSTAERAEAARLAGLHLERTNQVMLLAALASSLIVGVLTSRSVGRSVTRLIEATRAVGDGRFGHRLDAGGDELGRLAEAWNLMTGRLDALDRMKKDFVARVSHDLRTPLVAMRETTDLLLAGLAGPLEERQARLLRLHRESGRRLAGRIANLLALSRIEAGAFELDLKVHDLGELVRFALREMLVPARRRGLDLAVDLPAHAVPLRCDDERITQVLENLLDNAVKHAPRGGRIEVTSNAAMGPPAARGPAHRPWSSPGHAAIVVADNGPGVPTALRERIFESFYRAEGTPAERGSGLGLAICRDLVQAHGGRIWADQRPGGGARFHVVLPWDGATATAAAPTGATEPIGHVGRQPVEARS